MNKILITADLHGSFHPVRNIYNYMIEKQEPLTKEDVLIILGDFGANFFFNYRDIKLKKKLGKYNITYFVIRGNHEERPSICMEKNPEAWHMEEFWGNQVYVENDFSYIKYALDTPAKYEIPTAQGNIIKTLVLPGAYSVDKYYRCANDLGWFPTEQCTKEEMAAGVALAQSNTWDLVLSHTCPAIYEPTDLFLPFINQFTVDKTTERWLGEIEYNLDYKLWMFGHFHKNRIYPKVDNKEKIMIFNDGFFNLYKYFENFNTYDSLTTL
jgi:3-oxoacid CoA-transferase subunit A